MESVFEKCLSLDQILERDFKVIYDFLILILRKNQNLIENVIKGVSKSKGNERFFCYFIKMILETERKEKDENFISNILKFLSKSNPEHLLPFINEIFENLFTGISKRNVVEIIGEVCIYISKKKFKNNLVEIIITLLDEKDTFVRQKSIGFLKTISTIHPNMSIEILVR